MFDEAFSLQNLTDFLESRRDASLWEPNLAQSMNVAEFLTAVFQDDDRSRKTEAALEETRFMNDILPGTHLTVSLFVFGSHHQKRNRCRVEHFAESVDIGDTRHGNPIEFVPRQSKSILNEVFQLAPGC